MKGRDYVKLYLGTGFNDYYVEWTPVAYLYDGVRLHFVTSHSEDIKVTATLVLKNGISTSLIGSYSEERYFYRKSVTFDFSSYLTQLYQQNLFRLIPETKEDMSAHRFYLPYFKREGETTEDFPSLHVPIERIDFVVDDSTSFSLTEPFLVLPGDNCEGEELCKDRTHLLPVNFPSVVEFIPIGTNEIALCRDDSDEATFYNDSFPATDNIYTMAVNLIDRLDLRYTDEIRAVKFTCPSHLETQSEQSECVPCIEWDISFLRQFITTGTRSDLFLIDTRTKGCFLRFYDRFGFVSQILLDVVQEETVYTGGNIATASIINDFGYQHFGRDEHVNYRKCNSINRTTEQRVIHCTLERVTKDLREELEDLACSPCVVMLEVDKDVNYWREVSLSCQSIIENKKERLIDFSCDITLGGRQRW